MARKERKSSEFLHLLAESVSSIHDTLTLFKDPAPMGAKKVEWEEVIGAANGIAKHATTTGILWKAKLAKKEGVENIESYTRALQGFLLFCHGSTVGAGTTLLTFVDLAARQVANASINLLRGVVATKAGTVSSEQEIDIPVLVGHVWEACEAVKKTPSSNHVAIGRSLTQVAISIKDVLREIDEFKQGSPEECSLDAANDINNENEASSSDENELSEEVTATEMQVVRSVKDFVFALLSLLKQLLYIVAAVAKPPLDRTNNTNVLEKLLVLSKDLGVGVDELGASLYPPQEIEVLQQRVQEIEGLIESLQGEVFSMSNESVPESFTSAFIACKGAAVSLTKILDASGDFP